MDNTPTRILDIDALGDSFRAPPAHAQATPLYWWSGADLSRDKLAHHLDLLQEAGIGGTIVGYSHHSDTSLDHGDPTPFSDEWWSLLEWFTSESAARSLTVGMMDYGIISTVLRTVAPATAGLHAGSLSHRMVQVSGGTIARVPLEGAAVVAAAAWPAGSTPIDGPEPIAVEIGSDELRWSVLPGEWTLSVVLRRPGRIGPRDTDFDPMHPNSGAAVIAELYEPFAAHIGPHFGTVFTTFFQDELDLGLMMPMWNDDVARRLRDAGFEPTRWVHALWLDLGDRTLEFRATYRDAVVGLLERHYFKPIYRWHDSRGSRLVMDQMSRGDLRTGRTHYGDFLEVMKWYHGPGNDDPDLNSPSNVTAFRVSASIAHLHDRPLVINEAFHSSGWGVTPATMVRAANLGFVSGANHLILHGLYYTTEGGWWEWASPDFHFRQPWWQHSRDLWRYFARVSEMLRAGRNVADVAIVDPTQDIDLSLSATGSPELARALLGGLGENGVNADVVPMNLFADSVVIASETLDSETLYSEIELAHSRYRVVVIPAIQNLRDNVLTALARFAAQGGKVVVVGPPPVGTEMKKLLAADTEAWDVLPADIAPAELAAHLASLIDPDIRFGVPGVAAAHRSVDGGDLYFLVNMTEADIHTSCSLRSTGRIELWDAWTGDQSTIASTHPGRSEFNVSLRPGESATYLIRSAAGAPALEPENDGAIVDAEVRAIPLSGPWTARVRSTLDNRFGDFEVGNAPVGVETWRVQTGTSSTGPWTPHIVRDGVRFFALGPVAGEDAAEVGARLATLRALDATEPVEVAGGSLAWRPYRFSLETGIDHDPASLDNRTGPHGLKFVPDEFLDPAMLDPRPPVGSVYFFWSTVDSVGAPELLTVTSRSATRVWVDGRPTGIGTPETPVRRLEPWDLLDATAVRSQGMVATGATRSSVLVALTVTAEQPTRAAVVIGGSGFDSSSKARLRWWSGAEPARDYSPELRPGSAGDPGSAWLKVTVPPGALAATIDSGGVVSARVGGEPMVLRSSESAASITVELPRPTHSRSRELVVELRASGPWPDASALRGPIVWECEDGPLDLADWRDLGLADFSGTVTYSTSFALDAPLPVRARLVLNGLVGTATVAVNGSPLPTAMLISNDVTVDAYLRPGRNDLRIEVANTLANFYARVPSPYSAMHEPGGGFVSAEILLVNDR
ncbi:glycosyl hydrolase [Lacisediminihabitans sp. FW035]